MFSKLTPCSPIRDGRMEQFVKHCDKARQWSGLDLIKPSTFGQDFAGYVWLSPPVLDRSGPFFQEGTVYVMFLKYCSLEGNSFWRIFTTKLVRIVLLATYKKCAWCSQTNLLFLPHNSFVLKFHSLSLLLSISHFLWKFTFNTKVSTPYSHHIRTSNVAKTTSVKITWQCELPI